MPDAGALEKKLVPARSFSREQVDLRISETGVARMFVVHNIVLRHHGLDCFLQWTVAFRLACGVCGCWVAKTVLALVCYTIYKRTCRKPNIAMRRECQPDRWQNTTEVQLKSVSWKARR